jgi:hypothetical protein
MKAIQFIQQDLKRGTRLRPPLLLLVGVATLAFPIVSGIGFRQDYVGVFDLRILIPNLLGALLLGLSVMAIFQTRFRSGKTFNLAAFALGLGLLLASERVIFPAGDRTFYASPLVFWNETVRCFAKGILEGLLMGLALSFSVFRFSSWPSRRWRALIAFAVGVSGAVMLGFHCDSSSASHVFIGHVGQGLVTGLGAYFFQSRLFSTKVRNLFPKLGSLP